MKDTAYNSTNQRQGKEGLKKYMYSHVPATLVSVSLSLSLSLSLPLPPSPPSPPPSLLPSLLKVNPFK